MGGWIKTIENENFEFYECVKCDNADHNYLVVKKGIVDDRRKK